MTPTKTQITNLLKDCQSKQGTLHAVVASKDILEAVLTFYLRRMNDGMDHGKRGNGDSLRKMHQTRKGKRQQDNQVQHLPG